MMLTWFPLIPPEEFSGSSLTQKWNVGASSRRLSLPPTGADAAQHAASKVTQFFPVSSLLRKFVSQGACASPAGRLARTCHLGSYSASFVRRRELVYIDGHTPEPKAPVVTRVLTRGQACRAADDIPYYWNPETRTTTHGGYAQCNKLKQEYAQYDPHAPTCCTFSNTCTFHPILITSRYLVVESRVYILYNYTVSAKL